MFSMWAVHMTLRSISVIWSFLLFFLSHSLLRAWHYELSCIIEIVLNTSKVISIDRSLCLSSTKKIWLVFLLVFPCKWLSSSKHSQKDVWKVFAFRVGWVNGMITCCSSLPQNGYFSPCCWSCTLIKQIKIKR